MPFASSWWELRGPRNFQKHALRELLKAQAYLELDLLAKKLLLGACVHPWSTYTATVFQKVLSYSTLFLHR